MQEAQGNCFITQLANGKEGIRTPIHCSPSHPCGGKGHTSHTTPRMWRPQEEEWEEWKKRRVGEGEEGEKE